MFIRQLHSWRIPPRDAIQLQKRLQHRVRLSGLPCTVRTIAGADISWDPQTKKGYAGVIVFAWPGLRELDRAWAEGPAAFPYVPGLLSFREGPLLLEAFEKLKVVPDLIFFDGHGYAHPRRFGIASHLGLILGKPAIGCGKTRLVGEFKPPRARRGAVSVLKHQGEVIGRAVRTREDAQPVFVSVGNKITLDQAVRWALACADGKRIPVPTREADRFVDQLRRAGLGAQDAEVGIPS